jgi:hypothetical protein
MNRTVIPPKQAVLFTFQWMMGEERHDTMLAEITLSYVLFRIGYGSPPPMGSLDSFARQELCLALERGFTSAMYALERFYAFSAMFTMPDDPEWQQACLDTMSWLENFHKSSQTKYDRQG